MTFIKNSFSSIKKISSTSMTPPTDTLFYPEFTNKIYAKSADNASNNKI